jgi:hypothetical protein
MCAIERDGTITRTRRGAIVCGSGDCVRKSNGKIICSDEPGGSVLLDNMGTVHCDGLCEEASADNCERTPAGQ